MVRVQWIMFVVSVLAVTYLCVTDGRVADEEPEAKQSPPVSPESRIANEGATTEVTTESAAPAAVEKEIVAEPGTEVRQRPEPKAFMDALLALARAGKLEQLTEHLSPGVRRMVSGLFLLAMSVKAGGDPKTLERVLKEMRFEFEDVGDGLVRLHALDPEGRPSPEPVYLVPHEDTWQLATERDLPGPAADLQHAMNSLKLLALSQQTYFAENLGTGLTDYAESVYELASAMDRSDLYEGVLDPDIIQAVDRGLSRDGYVYGMFESGGKGFAYYATPDRYGIGARETLLIDGEGRVWAKDLEGNPPPPAWPAGNLTSKGWKQRRSTWR